MASVNKRKWTHNGVTKEAWVVRYFDEKGVRRSKQFEQKKPADAFKRKVERDIEDGTHVASEYELTVKEVCERYYTASENRRRRGEIGETRLVQLRIFLDKHIVPHVGHLEWRALSAGDVDGLYDTLTRTLAPFGARMIVSNLGTIERWAARQGFVRVSPVGTALTGIKRVPMPRIDEFTAEQVAQLLGHVARRDAARKRYAALIACYVHLAACCGLRLGEICALDRESVDLDNMRLRIRRNRTCLGEVKGPKSQAGNRDVPIPDHLCAMLRDWLETHYRANEGEFVFTTYTDQPIGPTNFRHGWHTVLKECGLYRAGAVFHFHALRHFAGSWWLEHGMPIQDVARQLGHKDASTTLQIYAHTVSKVADRQAAMTRMGQLLLTANDATLTQQAA